MYVRATRKGRLLVSPFVAKGPLDSLSPSAIPYSIVLLARKRNSRVNSARQVTREARPLVVSAIRLTSCFSMGKFHARNVRSKKKRSFSFNCIGLARTVRKSTLPIGNLPCAFKLTDNVLLRTRKGAVCRTNSATLFSSVGLVKRSCPVSITFLPVKSGCAVKPGSTTGTIAFLGPQVTIPVRCGVFPLVRRSPGRFLTLLSSKINLVVRPKRSVSLWLEGWKDEL